MIWPHRPRGGLSEFCGADRRLAVPRPAGLVAVGPGRQLRRIRGRSSRIRGRMPTNGCCDAENCRRRARLARASLPSVGRGGARRRGMGQPPGSCRASDEVPGLRITGRARAFLWPDACEWSLPSSASSGVVLARLGRGRAFRGRRRTPPTKGGAGDFPDAAWGGGTRHQWRRKSPAQPPWRNP